MPVPRARTLADLVVAAGLLALAVATLVFVIPVEIVEPRTRFGAAQGALSPATLPKILCVLIGTAAAVYLWRTLAAIRSGADALPGPRDASFAVCWQIVAIVALAAAYIWSFDRFSFAYTTPPFLLAGYLILAERPRRPSVVGLAGAAAGAVAFTLLIQTIFERGLKVYLGA